MTRTASASLPVLAARRLAALLAALLLGAAAAAQDASPRFERLGIDDGLSQASARAVADDARGFIWIGTQEGLNRYDGYQVVAFRHDPEDAQSLSDNNVVALLADPDGTLWVGTLNGGLNRRDPHSGRFQRYASNPDDPQALAHPWVRALVRDASGTLWAGSAAGLHRLDDGRFRRYRHDPSDPGSLGHDAVRSLLVDAAGTLWVGTDGGGLSRLDRGSERFQHYRRGPGGLSSDFIWSLAAADDGRLWVGTQEGGIELFDPASGRAEPLPLDAARSATLAGSPVMGLERADDGQLWIATRGGGLGLYVAGERRLRWFRNEPGFAGSLSHNVVFAIHRDAAGVIWAGTAEGLNRLVPLSMQFQHVRRLADQPGSLSHDWVRCFHEDPAGQLWVGTQEGLNRWDAQQGRWQVLRRDPATPRARERDHVRALADAADGRLWVGHDDGLDLLDPASGEFSAVPLQTSAGAAVDRVTTLLAEPGGTLWIGTQETGLLRRDAAGRLQRWQHDPADPSSLAHNQVRAIHRDRRGRLWLGTWGGGLCQLQEGGGFTCHRRQPGRAGSLPNDVVRAIHEDAAGVLWLATQGGGLVRFDPERAEARGFGRRDGLDDDSVYGVLADAAGQLWLSTNSGLSRFDPASATFRNYALRDGLQSREFNTGAYLRRRDGRLLFGGIGGFNQFDPATLQDDTRPPPLVFTELRVLNRPVAAGQEVAGLRLPAPIENLDHIALDHRQRQLSIEFSALSFTDPRRNRYAYRLEGFDADWIETDWRNRRATYTALAAGHYRLQARASNAHGVWSAPVSIAIDVAPAPWLSLPALLLYGLGLVVLARAALRWRTARIRAEARRLQAEVQARTADLQRSNDELERLSRTDPLTGLGNRRFLSQALRAWRPEPAGARRRALLLLDIDHFKRVNDQHGHAAGDAVLVEVARRLQDECAAHDQLARWGGEEFLLCLACADEAEAMRRAERLRERISATPCVVADSAALTVQVSIGVACLPFDPAQPGRLGWERVIALADAALYLAKQEGRNRVIGVAPATALPPQFDDLLRGPATSWLQDPSLRVLRGPIASC